MSTPHRVEKTVLVLLVIATILVGLIAFASAFAGPGQSSSRTLSFEDRLAAQRAMEEVYWLHRIWPAENGEAKPPLEAVLSPASIRSKVEDYLEKSAVLETIRRQPITAAHLQAEMDRMARDSRNPAMLAELFAALGDDPFLVAECLARPALVERSIEAGDPGGGAAGGYTVGCPEPILPDLEPPSGGYSLPRISPAAEGAGCLADTWTPSVVSSVPSVRAGHSAVWTGTEMIVWGGYDGYDPPILLDSGGRYDPVADTWRPTGTGPGVPEQRAGHGAIWTGSEMIVWGGVSGSGYESFVVNSGGRYDPATDSWTPTSMGANVPSPRTGFALVWTGTEMIVWGGTDQLAPTNTGGRYDPVNDTWKPVSMDPNVPSPRTGSGLVWTGSEMIVWGGTDGLVPTNTGGRYDPVTDSWTPTSTGAGVPEARFAFEGELPAVWSGSELIVTGGLGLVEPLDSGGRYDPVTDTWRAIADIGWTGSGRMTASLWTGSEMIIYIGAGAGYGWRYDPLADAWSSILGSSGVAVGDTFSYVWTGTEMIQWGGDEGNSRYNTGSRYDPATETWTRTGMGVFEREGHSAVWTGAEMIVWGGNAKQGGYCSLCETDTGGIYDPATGLWKKTSLTAATPAARRNHTAVWTGREMIVWGGLGISELNTGGRFDPATNSWSPTPLQIAPEPRTGHSAVWTGREMIVWGGERLGRPKNTGSRYDPAINRWRATATTAGVPRPRVDHTAVWTGSEMIVWGGVAATGYQTTGGRYNPVTNKWTATSTGANVASARASHTAVWTGSEMIVWGGKNLSGARRTGSRYNPVTNSWTPVGAAAGTPSARYDHTAAWTGSEMIVWGGTDGTKPLDSGGRYAPASNAWTPTSPAGVTAPRRNHSVVLTGHEMIVWGGLQKVVQGEIWYEDQSNTGGQYCYAP